MISCYDLEENLITIFDTYKDCAKWFNTTVEVIYSYISKSRKGIADKIRDYEYGKWYRLFKIEEV